MTPKTKNNQPYISPSYASRAIFSRVRIYVVHFFQNIKNRMRGISGKKLTTSFSPLLVIVIVVGIFLPHAAHAVWYNPFSWVGNTAVDIASAIFSFLFYIIQVILITLLTIISYIVDNLFWYNVILNPTNMPAVKSGWVIMRDIANGLFLLLIVYIAIQIIWGIGGMEKRLLVRVILIAFLINFSLAITGVVFGFGNALARPFQKALGSDVAGFIVAKTQINTVQKESTDAEINAALTQADVNIAAGECPLSTMTDFKDTSQLGCVLGGQVTAAMGAMSGIVAGVANRTSIQTMMHAAIADIFLVLIVLMYCGVAAFLIVRIVMMAFLGAVSAGAFFLSAIPHTGTKALFDDWLKALIGWAFIAPAFYFLFYLSLLMLEAMTRAPITSLNGTMSLAANLFAMLPFVIFLFFIKTTMNICKKLGGKIAEAAIAMGQTVGKVALGAAAGVATGGASLALGAVGGAAARGLQSTAQGTTEWLAKGSVRSKLTAPLTNRVRGYYQQRNSEIDKQKGEHDGKSSRDLTQELKTTLSTDKKVAIAEVLHKRGDFDKLDKPTQDKVMGYSNQFGRENLLTARPDLATTKNVFGLPNNATDADAQKQVLKKMTSDQKANISKYAIDNDEVKQSFLETATTKDIQEMMKKNADMTQKIIYEYFDTLGDASNKALQDALSKENPDTFQFINSNMRLQTGRTRRANEKYESDFATLEKEEEEEAKKKASSTP